MPCELLSQFPHASAVRPLQRPCGSEVLCSVAAADLPHRSACIMCVLPGSFACHRAGPTSPDQPMEEARLSARYWPCRAAATCASRFAGLDRRKPTPSFRRLHVLGSNLILSLPAGDDSACACRQLLRLPKSSIPPTPLSPPDPCQSQPLAHLPTRHLPTPRRAASGLSPSPSPSRLRPVSPFPRPSCPVASPPLARTSPTDRPLDPRWIAWVLFLWLPT